MARSAISQTSGALDRTNSTWTIADRKVLRDAVLTNRSVLDAAKDLDRDPIPVLRELSSIELRATLAKHDLEFQFERGSEEEVELLGLALNNVPLGDTFRWCLAKDDRPTATQLQQMMAGGDLRGPLRMAVDLGLWLTGSGAEPAQLDAMRYLYSQPEAEVRRAILETTASFDAPTPAVVQQRLRGVKTRPEAPYPWLKQDRLPDFKPGVLLTSLKAGGKKSSGTKKYSSKTKRWTHSGPTKSSSSRGRRRSSPSVPTGAPVRDTRSAADKAWESKTHW